jgi:hypothetical protein
MRTLAPFSLAIVLTPFLACGTQAPKPADPASAGASASLASAASSGLTPKYALPERCQEIDFDAIDRAVVPPPGAPSDGSDDGAWTGSMRKPYDPMATCQMADANIGSAADAVLAQATNGRAAFDGARWDRKTPPKYLDLVDRRFHLSAAEKAQLAKEGFVVPARLESSNYAWAFHELYQSQIPLYVSVDAIFHAVYTSNDTLVAAIERSRLAPLLSQALAAMHCRLGEIGAKYPPDLARDLDLYLTVARRLGGDEVSTLYGQDAQADALVKQATDAKELAKVTLFGRERMIDFSAFTPRGHYVGDLERFFRTAMWLSRLEFNLVSRDCRSSQPGIAPDPSETPREALDALGLADLVEQAKVGPAIELLDKTWGLLAGRREDVSIAQLSALRKEAGIGSLDLASFPALEATIGARFKRRARIHYMPEGVKELPTIATLLGPRVVADTRATRPLVHDEVVDRGELRGVDMAYVLGQDRAKTYLASELAKYPTLEKQLGVARAIADEPLGEGDLYSAWFGAIRALGKRPDGVLPSFMDTTAFADLRVDSTVAAFGQLRHNYVLMAGQGYDGAGCEIPDGFVDPVPAVYDGLIAYADRGASVMRELDPKDTLATRAYFARLGKTLKVLRAIAVDELAGRALTDEERRFLSMVAEFQPPGTGSGPTYTGWYYDLFRSRVEDGLKEADFVADFHTSVSKEKISYVGASAPRLGIFVVDTGGAPRVVVGPVAHAYQLVGPLAKRLNDEEARAATGKEEPWAASYTVTGPAAPPIALIDATDDATARAGARVLRVASSRKLGPVTIELLDHHRVAFASATRAIGPGEVRLRFTPGRPSLARGGMVEAVRVKASDFDVVVPIMKSAMGEGWVRIELGGMKVPE